MVKQNKQDKTQLENEIRIVKEIISYKENNEEEYIENSETNCEYKNIELLLQKEPSCYRYYNKDIDSLEEHLERLESDLKDLENFH